MKLYYAAIACLLLLQGASANDPAGSWLSYAVFKAENEGRITQLNTTWTVPSNPQTSFGSNAPGWWFGVQTADGALREISAVMQRMRELAVQGATETYSPDDLALGAETDVILQIAAQKDYSRIKHEL